MRLSQALPQEKIVATLSQEFTWSHFVRYTSAVWATWICHTYLELLSAPISCGPWWYSETGRAPFGACEYGKLYALLSSKGRPRDGLGHLRKGGRITESPPRASREKARSSTWALHVSGEARPRPEAVSCFDPDGRCVSVGNFGEIPGEAPKLSNPKQLSYPPRCKGSGCN